MPKTSAIRHPKHEHFLTVHSWQFKACGKHLYAALLLSYLEDKFNHLLQLENKNKGWMKLNIYQIQNGIFADSRSYVDTAFEMLLGLRFVQINPASPEFPRDENEIWVKLNALEINRWIDMHSKTDEIKMNLLEFNPFIILMVLSGTEEVVKEVVEVEVKSASPLKKFENDLPLIQKAKNLFYFWKWVTDKPRSQPQDKYLRMIIDRLQDGYSEIDLALSFYGMLYRKNTEFAKYDAIHYIVKEAAKVDRFTAYAIEIGFDEDIAAQEFEEFLAYHSIGQIMPRRKDMPETVVKNESGVELK